MNRIRRVFAGWSWEHYLLDAFLTLLLTTLFNLIPSATVGTTVLLGMSSLGITTAGMSLLIKRTPVRPDTTLADICSDLAREALTIRGQEKAEDWCRDVAAILSVNHAAELSAFAAIVGAIFSEKPSAALIESSMRRACLCLRACAVRIRRVDEMMMKQDDSNSIKVIAKLYEEIACEGATVSSAKDAKAWIEKASRVLNGTGQSLNAAEFVRLAYELEGDHVDVHAVMEKAMTFWKTRTAFASGALLEQ